MEIVFFFLKSTSNNYFQVQLQMFPSGLTTCTFVVWTNKGILTVEVLCDPGFMCPVCFKLEQFWTSQPLPFFHGKQNYCYKDLSPKVVNVI